MQILQRSFWAGETYYNKVIKQGRKERKERKTMSRKLIIDGNAVYEIDEECMLRRKIRDGEKGKSEGDKNRKEEQGRRERLR